MGNAENAKLYYEAGQTPVAFTALSDAGDHLVFNSAANVWSKKSGSEAVVRPNGLVSGCEITPAASGTNNLVDTASGYAYIAGVLTAIEADTDVECTRPAGSGDDCKINSLTITSAGAIAVVAGADHTDLSTTRGGDGGPGWIPTTSIEIGQVKYTSDSPAAVLSSEIYQVINTHQERFDYPVWTEKPINVSNQVAGYAGVEFNAALPQIHSDDAGSTTAGKIVYAQYSEPAFAEQADAENFVAPENAYSVSSKQVYGRTLGSTSASLGGGSFTFYSNDGITDNLIKLKGGILTFKFYPDRLKAPYIICQGKLGIARTFPAGDNISVACTISSEAVSEEVAN